MPKAHEVASELRKLADSLDREPDAQIVKPMISFYCDEKEHFLNLARLFPRPFNKNFGDQRIELERDSRGLWLRTVIERSKVCELVEPAKPAVYRCEPLLSEAEEAALETAVAE